MKANTLTLLILFLLLSGFVVEVLGVQDTNDTTFRIHTLTPELIQTGYPLSGWTKYHEGDIPGAYEIDFDDSTWDTWSSMWMSARNLPQEWVGVRWYRHHLSVDSTLFNADVSFLSVIFGAADIWLNGELVISNGVASADPELYERGDARIWVPVTLGNTTEQIIAVRFVNAHIDRFQRGSFSVGMNLRIHDVKRSYHAAIAEHRFLSGMQWFIVGFCIVFAIIHFLFFLFNRRLLFNLWFALVCTLFGFGAWVQSHFFFYQDVEGMIQLQIIMQMSMLMCFAFMSLFLHSVLNLKFGWVFRILFGSAALISVIHVFVIPINPFLIISALLIGLYILFISIRSIWMGLDGAWLLGSAVMIFILSVFLVVALEMSGRFMNIIGFSIFQAPYLGFGIALIAMSVYQSRRLATLNLDLLRNLREVKQLSEKNLENERSIREAEIQRARLETENERKTAELENARSLQLSMLPASLPEIDHYELSAAMFTATEVGGDYYDVLTKDDSSTVFAIGDATGHGTEAGFVVAMTKTLFQTMGTSFASDECLRRMSATLKNAGLRKKFMCLGLLTVNDDTIQWCSAGIPAAIIYKAKTGEIELLESKGMPLATVINFPYQTKKTKLQKNDVVILISDGLTEQMNQDREQFGMDRIADCIKKTSGSSTETVIQRLMECMHEWSNGEPQHDDITMLCLKRLK